MKKRITIISLILAISVVAVSIFAFNIGASTPDTEAKLSVLQEGGTEVVSEGSLDDMLTTLEGALSPKVATEYTLTLLCDAVATKALVLDGNGTETVNIRLEGNELTSAVTDLITVGNIAALNIQGGFDNSVNKGAINYTGTGSAIATEIDSTARIELQNLAISASSDAASVGVIQLEGGEVVCEYVDITLDGAADARAISGDGAKVTLRISNIRKSVADGTAPIVMEDAVLRLERGSIESNVNIELNGDSFVTVIDTELDATAAVFTTTSGATDSIVNFGGVTINAPAIADGEFDGKITAWYGTGSTYIKGFDPKGKIALGQEIFAFASLDGGYTITTTSSSAAMTTTFTDRATPTVTSGTFSTCLKVYYQAAPETPTAYTMALLADATLSGSSATTLSNGNVNATVFFDLNGHSLTRTRAGNLFIASGTHTIYMDGKNAGGVRGIIKNPSTNGALIYNKEAQDNAFLSMTGIDLDFSNQYNTSSLTPMVQLVYGDTYIDDFLFLYTGLDNENDSSAINMTMLRAQAGARAVVTNTEFKCTATNGMNTTAINANGTGNHIYAKDITTDVYQAASAGGTSTEIRIAESSIKVSGRAYNGSTASRVTVVDTETVSAVSDVANNNVYFLMGNGKNIVKSATGSVTGGTFEKENYGFFMADDGSGFIISYSTISMPEIYVDGMVLQARKEMHVVGNCTTEGATVEVKLGDIATSTATVVDGKFSAGFDNLPYAKNITVTITELGSSSQPVRLINVDLGEIWVMSGQSNSVYDVTNLEDFEEYRLNADNYDNIKAYIIPQSMNLLEQTKNNGEWHKVDKAYLTKLAGYSMTSRHSIGLSAIAYVMATRLATELPEATIAIIDANFNGSTVEAWIDYDVALEYAPNDAANYKLYMDYYLANGKYPATGDITVPDGYDYISDSKLYQKMATACYNKMIAPLDGFSVAGTVWYQGEGNGGSVTSTSDGGYYNQFCGVRQTFRNTFGDQNMPMFVIQIPPRFSIMSDFKNLQYKMVADDANSYIVANTVSGTVFSSEDFVTSSLSDSMVHYARKSPMGLSLAAEILENIYDFGKLGAPKIESTKVSGSYLTITFDRDIALAWGEEFAGFELGNAAGEFKEAIATVVDSRTLKLYAPGISTPKSVRYGYGRTSFELEDGNVIEMNMSTYTFSATETATEGVFDVVIKDKASGEVLYEFSSDDSYIVRTISNGNVISTTGQSLPDFRIDF